VFTITLPLKSPAETEKRALPAIDISLSPPAAAGVSELA